MSNDIFKRRTTSERRAPRQQRVETPSWREQQIVRFTSSGSPYEDHDTSERLAFAVFGKQPDRESSLFGGALATALRNGTVAYRLWRAVGDAPDRCADGSDRISTRGQTSVRNAIAAGEDRGPLRPKFPFRPTLIKSGRSSSPEPLFHGHLVVERGFDLGTLDPEVFRRVTKSDFPTIADGLNRHIDSSSTGMPLVVGDSTGNASWRLLSEYGALAVYTGRDLWTFVALEPFSDPVEIHRQRVAPPNTR
jgi:hypothetical protein